MRNLKYYLAFLVMMGPVALSAQSSSLQSYIDEFRNALVDADSVRLSALLHEKLSYGHSSGKIEGKASLISSLTSGQSDFLNIALSDQSIQVVENTAIVRHTLAASINDNNKPGDVKLSVVLVWVRIRKEWKLLARQGVKIV